MNKKLFFVFLISIYIIQGLFCMEDFRTSLSKHYFYNAVYRCDYEWTENHLKAGYDPNKCVGDAGWYDSNPLKVLCEKLVGDYEDIRIDNHYEHKIPIEYKRMDIFYLLFDYGVDINRLPYVWQRVYCLDNHRLNRWWENEEKNSMIPEDKKKTREQTEKEYIYDANLLLEALLKAGADPNMKGHPFPYSHSLRVLFFTDRIAFRYFNSREATTPLYEVIKKGIKWESQVDLLLEYGAILDESCLEAAKLSGDEYMIEKIQRFWEERKGK